ncbi:MAG: SDR family NAD(P)-dependent oxidoreductase [Pseudomonadota bacterium]
MIARSHSKWSTVADACTERHGIETPVVGLDLSDRAAVDQVADVTRALDVGLLVACAGFGTSGPLIDADLEPDMIDVNCTAVLALSHIFAKRFVRQGRGGMILMSSLFAFQGVPRAAHYAATKAYVQTLAEGLRLGPMASMCSPARPGRSRAGSRRTPICRWAWRKSPTRSPNRSSTRWAGGDDRAGMAVKSP